jgi:hypothetical protein
MRSDPLPQGVLLFPRQSVFEAYAVLLKDLSSIVKPIEGRRPVNPFRSFLCESHDLYSVTAEHDMECGILNRGGR